MHLRCHISDFTANPRAVRSIVAIQGSLAGACDKEGFWSASLAQSVRADVAAVAPLISGRTQVDDVATDWHGVDASSALLLHVDSRYAATARITTFVLAKLPYLLTVFTGTTHARRVTTVTSAPYCTVVLLRPGLERVIFGKSFQFFRFLKRFFKRFSMQRKPHTKLRPRKNILCIIVFSLFSINYRKTHMKLNMTCTVKMHKGKNLKNLIFGPLRVFFSFLNTKVFEISFPTFLSLRVALMCHVATPAFCEYQRNCSLHLVPLAK